MFRKSPILLFSICMTLFIASCKKPVEPPPISECGGEATTPYTVTRPAYFPSIPDMSDNPLTEEGIALGKKLFYEKLLSKDNSMSCSSCHNPAFSFTDNGKKVSKGVNNIEGTRNSMSLLNLLWAKNFFWDGREATLEKQAHDPVTNPIEMHETWPSVVEKLQNSSIYPDLFCKAFGTNTIDSNLVTKAIAQFERTIISTNTRYDKFIRHEISLTESETNGFVIYSTEKGDCFHCHNQVDMTFADNSFHNNGLDATFADKGLGAISGNSYDDGKFKTPTLRNIVFTAPYMHDGRFATLEDVIEHYNQGGTPSATVDPMMKHVGTGLNLTEQDKTDLLNFLKCLTDSSVTTNPAFLE